MLSQCFLNLYPRLFMRGIARDDIPKDAVGVSFIDRYPDLFMQCLNDDDLLQVCPLPNRNMEDSMEILNVELKHRAIINQLFKRTQISNWDTEKLIVNLVPEMQEIFDYWNTSDISILSLSSVGIVLGAQYTHLSTKLQFDLSIWI